MSLWTTAARTPRARELRGHAGEPGAVAWAPDGSVLYSVSAEDGVRAWDVAGRTAADVVLELPEGR